MSSGFITESELGEARKRRQEEWEKVRKADEALERPDDGPYDGRSLFDRLKEQKMKKDMEYEEAHKLKNLIRGLDDDEVQFLEQIDQVKMAVDQRQMQEDEKELQEFRKRVATLQEENVDKFIQSEVKQTLTRASKGANASNRLSQKELLGIGIKRKNGVDTNEATKNIKAQKTEENKSTATIVTSKAESAPDKGQLKCIAILPGIGTYTDSSDSELSSGSEEELVDLGDNTNQYDLVGRRQHKKKQCGGNE